MEHVKSPATMHKAKIPCQRVAASRGNERNALPSAIEALQNFKDRSIAADSNHTIERLRVTRKFLGVPRMMRKNGPRNKSAKCRHQFGEPVTVAIATRMRIYNCEPIASQDYLSFSANTRKMLPTSVFHVGRMQIRIISSVRDTT